MEAKPLAQRGPDAGAGGASPNSQGTRASRPLPASPLILSTSDVTLQKQRTQSHSSRPLPMQFPWPKLPSFLVSCCANHPPSSPSLAWEPGGG